MATKMELTLTALLVAAVALAGAGLGFTLDFGSRLADLEKRLPPRLTVIGPWSGAEMEAFLPVLNAFSVKTGIEVDYRVSRAEDLAPVLPAQFEARVATADLIFMWDSFIRTQAPDGHIAEVTGIINATAYSAGALDRVTVDGKIYGGTYTGKVKPGFWYRKSFFADNDLTVPTTWDGFKSLLVQIEGVQGIKNAIVSGDEVGWPLSDVTEYFIATYGGPKMHRDLTAGTVSWTSAAVKTVFTDRLVPLLTPGSVCTKSCFSGPTEWTAAVDAWWQGDYGLYFMGSWITGMVDDPDDLGVLPLPGAQGIVFAPDFFFIPAYTPRLLEAQELFRFLASGEGQDFQVRQGGHLATIKDVPLNAYPDVDRQVAELLTGKEVLEDLDDKIGGEFQTTFWSQLKLLWVNPGQLDSVLSAIEAKAP